MTERRTEQLTQADLNQRFGETDEGQRMNPETVEYADNLNITDAIRQSKKDLSSARKRALKARADYDRLQQVERELITTMAKKVNLQGDPDKFWVLNEDVPAKGHKIDPAASGSPAESSGGDNDYWLLHIAQPKRKEVAPYTVECEDIIEAFEMTFQEGEAFKALWRKCGQRMGNGKPGNTALRDAEKVAHFGRRMVTIEQRKL